MSEAYISQMSAFVCNFTVEDWGRCKGQVISINQNESLFALLGTLFGGDGHTTFGIPDLQGRVPVGEGVPKIGGSYTLGQHTSDPFIYINKDNLPNTSIPVTVAANTAAVGTKMKASTTGPDTNNPAGAYQGTFPASQPVYAGQLSNPPVEFGDILVPSTPVEFSKAQTAPLGQSQPIDIRQPYMALNWQICIEGIFPKRGGP